MAATSGNTDNSNPLLKASCINKLFFWWLKDSIWYCQKHDLNAKDLYDTCPEDLSEPLRSKLETAWNNELADAHSKSKKPSLWKAVAKTYFWDLTKFTILQACFSSIVVIQPQLLELMMSYFQPMSTMTPLWAYLNATLFVVLALLRTIFFCHGYFHLNRLGMQAQIACTSLIYNKMIRLSSSAGQNVGSLVISLLAVDVMKLESFFIYVPFIAIVPVQSLFVTYFLWQYVGLVIAITAIALMVFLTLPIQALYGRLILILGTKQISKTDKRISLISEIIDGIRTIKMYVWEEYFEKLVHLARRREIQGYVKMSYVNSMTWTVSTICHRLCVFVVILIYTPYHGMLDVNKILPVTQHLYTFQLSIAVLFFFGVMNIMAMRVSMKRLEEFLLLQEVDGYVTKIKGNNNTSEIVSIENATVSWNRQSNVLTGINLNVAAKKFYAIVGSVGSGKSSLLKMILGEVQLVCGRVSVFGKVSYASQEPWLFYGSIRENILFGETFDKEKYEKVVDTCALLEDFSQLPYGDNTFVGDRSINLSGGQCARVNLARAVYREADVYLFDDPLSAVDARVAKKIMQECFVDLLKNKARILVTNNLQQLSTVDEVIFLDLGKIRFRGSLDDFKNNDHILGMLPLCRKKMPIVDGQESEVENSDIIAESSKSNSEGKEPERSEETIARGAMKKSIYTKYMRAGGLHYVFLLMLFNVLRVIFLSTFDFGLAAWTKHDRSASWVGGTETNNASHPVGSLKINDWFTKNFTTILGSLVVLSLLMGFLVSVCFHTFALNASKNIHNSMFLKIIKMPMQFFEANPSGRILNRFSEDTGITDNELPQALFQTMQLMFQTIGIFLPAVIVNWWTVIPSSICILICIVIGMSGMTAIQKIKRLVGTAKSPVLSFASSSLAGLITIRACRAEDIVRKDFDSYQDQHTAAGFLAIALSEALTFWIELINLGLLASIIYTCIIIKNDETLEGYVGLTLMQAFNIIMITSYLLTQFVNVFAHVTSVERILQFTDLKQETSKENQFYSKLPDVWPDYGEIKVQQLNLRYSDDSDPVLCDVNVTIEPGLKVGIVGRTGAGKSSLIAALFRLTEFDGSILIDGVDTKCIKLSQVRSKISIIPQEPVLFESTLRNNLDPFNEFDDTSLWSALKSVELQQIFDSLDSPIHRKGNNLSSGQRQLLCLARAILKKDKILVMDEATANVDSTTDALIQKTVKKEFKDCTVLTIAHRLNTIMDSDKILVMDKGRAVEYDHPHLLIQKNDSYFFKLVRITGDTMMQHFATIAEQAYRESEITK